MAIPHAQAGEVVSVQPLGAALMRPTPIQS